MKTLETKRLIVRHICDEDLDKLYVWRNSDLFCQYCSIRRNKLQDIEQFKSELKSDFSKDRHAQLIAIKRRNNIPIGTIWTYNLNLTDGYVFVTTYIDNEFQKNGYGVELFGIVVYSLFLEFQHLNKIYTEAYSYNLHSLTIMKRFGFLEEGVFKEHRLVDGNRYDLHRLSFYRQQFLEKESFISQLIKPLL
jgi:RimJ/RimL family protein N-acetyltransferase